MIFNFSERRGLKLYLFDRYAISIFCTLGLKSITSINKNKHFSLIRQFESFQSFRIICPLISVRTVFAATSKVMIHLSLLLGL